MVNDNPYVTLVGDGATAMYYYCRNSQCTVQYSTDGTNWSNCTTSVGGSTNLGSGTVYVRSASKKGLNIVNTTISAQQPIFTDVKTASGNLNALLYYTDMTYYDSNSLPDYAFGVLFGSSSSTSILTDISGIVIPKYLGKGAYAYAFKNQTGITSVPTGFNWSSSVVQIPENCFNSTFYGCTGLTTIPQGTFNFGNAYTFNNGCCIKTFYFCNNITGDLSWMRIGNAGYGITNNFYGTTNTTGCFYQFLAANSGYSALDTPLTKLPSITAYKADIESMALSFFSAGHGNVISAEIDIKVLTSSSSWSSLNYWLGSKCTGGKKAAGECTLTCRTNEDGTGPISTYLTANLPTGNQWTTEYIDENVGYLALTPTSSAIVYTCYNTEKVVEYSNDNGVTWNTCAHSSSGETTSLGGGASKPCIFVRSNDDKPLNSQLSTSQISFTNVAKVSGNMAALLRYTDLSYYDTHDLPEFAFCAAFASNTSLTSIADIKTPKRLGRYAYAATFAGCTALTTIPSSFTYDHSITEIPAGAFIMTFQNCTGLTTITEGSFDFYNVTKFNVDACYGTFQNCTNLTGDLSWMRIGHPTEPVSFLGAMSQDGCFYGFMMASAVRVNTPLRATPTITCTKIASDSGMAACTSIFGGHALVTSTKVMIKEGNFRTFQSWHGNSLGYNINAGEGTFYCYPNADRTKCIDTTYIDIKSASSLSPKWNYAFYTKMNVIWSGVPEGTTPTFTDNNGNTCTYPATSYEYFGDIPTYGEISNAGGLNAADITIVGDTINICNFNYVSDVKCGKYATYAAKFSKANTIVEMLVSYDAENWFNIKTWQTGGTFVTHERGGYFTDGICFTGNTFVVFSSNHAPTYEVFNMTSDTTQVVWNSVPEGETPTLTDNLGNTCVYPSNKILFGGTSATVSDISGYVTPEVDYIPDINTFFVNDYTEE